MMSAKAVRPLGMTVLKLGQLGQVASHSVQNIRPGLVRILTAERLFKGCQGFQEQGFEELVVPFRRRRAAAPPVRCEVCFLADAGRETDFFMTGRPYKSAPRACPWWTIRP